MTILQLRSVILLPSFFTRKKNKSTQRKMSKNTPLSASSNNEDMCTICLSALAVGTPILTLSCNHKFHLQCLAQNVQAQNKECPLCRDSLDPSIIQLLSGAHRPSILQLQRIPPNLFELQRQILSVCLLKFVLE